jgi:hypothetical protein
VMLRCSGLPMAHWFLVAIACSEGLLGHVLVGGAAETLILSGRGDPRETARTSTRMLLAPRASAAVTSHILLFHRMDAILSKPREPRPPGRARGRGRGAKKRPAAAQTEDLDDCSDDLPEDAASDEDAEDVPALCDEPEPPLKMAPKAAAALHEHVPLPKKKPKKPTAASAALHAHAPLPKKKPTAPLSTTATRKSSAAALTAFKKPASHLLREPLSALHCFPGSLPRWSEAALLAVKPARSAAVASRGNSHAAIGFSSEELKRLPDEQIIS